MTTINTVNDYTSKNFNISKCVANADSGLNLLKCRPNFRKFLGIQNEYRNLYELIDAQDVSKLKDKMSKINDTGFILLITSITRADNCPRKVLLKISTAQDTDRNKYAYYIELIDLYNVHDYLYTLEFRGLKYKKMLENYGNLFFEYNANTDILNIFSLASTTEEILVSDTLSNLVENANILPEDKANFDLLCKSLKNRETCFEYAFKKNPFIDTDETPAVIHGLSLSIDSGVYIIVGGIEPYSHELNHSEYSSNIKNLDMMTGLLNKKAVLDFSRNAINNQKYQQIFLVMLDLDNFKLVNDNYGHMTGDKVIREVAEILKRCVGAYGCVGRFGGDEFFACMHDLGGEGDLRAILDNIFNNISECYKNKFDGFNISLSVGISEYPRNGDNFELLFKKADRAVYIAKKKGKKRYIIYKEHLHGDIDLNSENNDYVLQLNTSKFAGDIKRYEVVKDGIIQIINNGAAAIDNFMQELINTYCLAGISVYAGEDFKAIKQWGNYTTPMPNADYMKEEISHKRFNAKNIFWENNVRANSFYIPIIHDKLLSYNILSTVQCIIGSADDIKGIVTFDLEQNTFNWTEEDLNYFGIISNILGQLIL